MEFPAKIPASVLTLIAGCLGIIFTGEAAVAQCPHRGVVVDEEVSNAQGKPYQARAITTIVTYGSNGTKHTTVRKSNLLRDSRGRIRIERFYDGSENPSELAPTDIWIDDNCGTSVRLLPPWQTAKITKRAIKGPDGQYCKETDLKNVPYTGPEGVFEYLGHRFIDGVEIRGERSTDYTSVQAKLSGAPPIHVYENWCSISLDTPMGAYISDDNPKRETTIVIGDIRQTEPDSALFEIPTGYKIARDQ